MFNITDYWRDANQNYSQIYFIQVRMTIMKKSTNNKCWRECREKGTLLCCSWECKLVQPLWRIVWRFLRKLKYDPAIPFLGIYSDNTKTLIQKDTCILMFIAALFTIAKAWEQLKCPSTHKWIKKMWCVCVCVYTYIHPYTHTHTQQKTQP